MFRAVEVLVHRDSLPKDHDAVTVACEAVRRAAPILEDLPGCWRADLPQAGQFSEVQGTEGDGGWYVVRIRNVEPL